MPELESSAAADVGSFGWDGPGALRSAWDSSPALVAVALGPELALAYMNRASVDLFGSRPLGVPMREGFPELGLDDLTPLHQVLETGVVIEAPPQRVGVRTRSGEEVFLRYVVAPLGRPGRRPDGVVMTAVDVTAEIRAEEAVRRARLLTELSDRLADASTPTAGLQALTDALVPELADVAAVYVLDDPPRSRSLDSTPVPPQIMTVADSLHAIGPPPIAGPRERPATWEGSVRVGDPVIVRVDETTLPEVAPDPDTAAWLVRAGAHTIAVLSLVVAGELTGLLLLMGAGDRPAYQPGDLPHLTGVAARAGSAIAHLSSQQRQARIALDLQRALLPAAPPVIPGLAIVVRYVAGAPGVEVGGDWWDVQDLGEGRVAIGIGDVSGRGVAAAAVMGQARASMRAAGRARLGPSDVLQVVDGQLHEVLATGLLAEPSAPHFATAAFGVLDVPARELHIANAGHLPPIVRHADGRTAPVWLPAAAPLGLALGRFADVTIPVVPGDTLLFYTDGLVELHDQDLEDGIAILSAALQRHGVDADLDGLADELLATMGARAGFGGDDVALVIVRVDTG